MLRCSMIVGSIPPERFILPNLAPSTFRRRYCTNGSVYSTITCRGSEICVLNPHEQSACTARETFHEENRSDIYVKEIDVATLGNLCVDIVLNVPKLPPESFDARKAYYERLEASPPDEKFWEAGGNCNMSITAARLGLKCTSIGHVGDEIYGHFLLDLLGKEGIDVVDICKTPHLHSSKTLLCWVLVDPQQRHGFCSRADFSKDPAFSWLRELSDEVKQTIEKSKILFCNGYGFDELPPELIMSSVEYAVGVGTSVFFDPGPRGRTLLNGSSGQREALEFALRMSDVLILTSEEAESLTGIDNPILAGKELMNKGVRTKWVLVKMGFRGSTLVTSSGVSCVSAFNVKVVDTVGCGDSFVAAVAFGFIHNMSMVTTLCIANAVGAATAMGSGAGRNVATVQQVIGLLTTPNFTDNWGWWNDLIRNTDIPEISILSNMAINGNDRITLTSMQEIVSTLTPFLEIERDKNIVL